MSPELEAYHKAEIMFKKILIECRGINCDAYTILEVLDQLSHKPSLQEKVNALFSTDDIRTARAVKRVFDEAFEKLTDEEKVLVKLQGDAPWQP